MEIISSKQNLIHIASITPSQPSARWVKVNSDYPDYFYFYGHKISLTIGFTYQCPEYSFSGCGAQSNLFYNDSGYTKIEHTTLGILKEVIVVFGSRSPVSFADALYYKMNTELPGHIYDIYIDIDRQRKKILELINDSNKLKSVNELLNR